MSNKKQMLNKPHQPNLHKAGVGSSAVVIEQLKNYWICVHTSGMVALESLAYSKPQSIKNKLATWQKDRPISKWRYWKHRGWNCIKVNVNFSQVNKKQNG